MTAAAIVGTGMIAAVHLESLRSLGVEVRGVVGSSPARGRERAAALGVPAYESLDAALADDAVEVVHVTSPNVAHFEQAQAVLEAGRHCVCEKPLATDSADSGELLRIAEGSGLVHATNLNQRYYPQLRVAHERIASGEIGTVRSVHGGYLQNWLLRATDWNWRLDPELGGPLATTADIGVHWIDLACRLAGSRVESVIADFTTSVPTRSAPGETSDRAVAVEDGVGLMLRMRSGARAVAVLSQVSPGHENHLYLEVDGATGTLQWDNERHDSLRLGRRGEPDELLTDAAPAEALADSEHRPAGHDAGFMTTFRDLHREVYAAVAAGGPSAGDRFPTFADGHELVLVVEALARSAREGRWVDVDRGAAD